MKMILGAHMSIQGGLDLALQRGFDVGCDAIQIFSKTSNQWKAKPLQEECIIRFKKKREETGVTPAMIHSSYLINLCTPKDEDWHKSIDAFYVEMERAEALEIPYLVLHPGAHLQSGEEAGIARVAQALNQLHERAAGFQMKVLIELTAGQGTCIGHHFSHVGAIFNQIKEDSRIGVCFDTCHVFAAGYDFRTKEGYDETMALFDKEIGLNRLCAFHLNDCKKDLGCRVDRHDHIGQGKIGLSAFSHLMNDARFVGLPMILETPKGNDCAEDKVNLATLRGLVK